MKDEVKVVEPEEVKESAADKKVQKRRVFRVEGFKPMYESLYTVNLPKRGDEPAVAKSLKPNPAQQYILPEEAEYYDVQLKALRNYEKQGRIKEVPASQEGVPYVHPLQQEIKLHEDKLRILRAQVE